MRKWMGLASLSIIILFAYQSLSKDNIEWLGLFAGFFGLLLSRFIID